MNPLILLLASALQTYSLTPESVLQTIEKARRNAESGQGFMVSQSMMIGGPDYEIKTALQVIEEAAWFAFASGKNYTLEDASEVMANPTWEVRIAPPAYHPNRPKAPRAKREGPLDHCVEIPEPREVLHVWQRQHRPVGR